MAEWKRFLFMVLVLPGAVLALAQSGAQALIDPARAIDWSKAGAGAIPARKTVCAQLNATATVLQINMALQRCPAGQTVYLQAGRYSIDGNILIPSNVTLRGAGADRTILDAKGRERGYVIGMGTQHLNYHPVRVAGGAERAGSTVLLLENASQIAVGKYLAIAERNDPALVSTDGVDGTCLWCDGEWTPNGAYARGQIVEVSAVRGDQVTVTPGLYSAYTHEPFVVPFTMSAHHAGVEDLQVYSNNTGYDANFGMNECAYCWIRGVASNYAEGDHVEMLWGFHDEVRDSYFSGAFVHRPGAHDSSIRLSMKTTASLVENNIVDRTHLAVMFSFGPAGNVVAYNYSTGEFDSGSREAVFGGIDFHAAHPQFNLLEGNVVPQVDLDAVWGSSSHTTLFRNWIRGTNYVCSLREGRGAVDCTEANSYYAFSAARALQISFLSRWNSVIGNVLGSQPMLHLKGWGGKQLPVIAVVEYPAMRSWDAVAYGVTVGYGSESDDGQKSGCAGGGKPPCHMANAGATQFFHGNFNLLDGSTRWVPNRRHELPASLYLSGKPDWWGTLPFPSTGPDVVGGPGPGGHSFGNPAQACYRSVMHGVEGGAGSPLPFNAARCYPGRP